MRRHEVVVAHLLEALARAIAATLVVATRSRGIALRTGVPRALIIASLLIPAAEAVAIALRATVAIPLWTRVAIEAALTVALRATIAIPLGTRVAESAVSVALRTTVAIALRTPIAIPLGTPVTLTLRTPVTFTLRTRVTEAALTITLRTPIAIALRTRVTIEAALTITLRTPVTLALGTRVTIEAALTIALRAAIAIALRATVVVALRTRVAAWPVPRVSGTQRLPVGVARLPTVVRARSIARGPAVTEATVAVSRRSPVSCVAPAIAIARTAVCLVVHGTIPSGSRNGKRGPRRIWGPSPKEVRRCPTLPQGPPCSTIGAESLSFRVRNVTGRFPLAMAAETLLMFQFAQLFA